MRKKIQDTKFNPSLLEIRRLFPNAPQMTSKEANFVTRKPIKTWLSYCTTNSKTAENSFILMLCKFATVSKYAKYGLL